MKKIASTIMAAICTMQLTTVSFAEELPDRLPDVYWNKEYVSGDKNPILKPIDSKEKILLAVNNSQYKDVGGTIDKRVATVPVIYFAAKNNPYGATLETDKDFIILKNSKATIKFKLNSNIMNVNGKNISTLTTCFIHKGRTQVPLELTVEALGGSVVGYELTDVFDSKNKGILSSRLHKYKINPTEQKEKFNELNFKFRKSQNEKWGVVEVDYLGDYAENSQFESFYGILIKDYEKDIFYPILYSPIGTEYFWDNNKLVLKVETLAYASESLDYGDKYYYYDVNKKDFVKVTDKSMYDKTVKWYVYNPETQELKHITNKTEIESFKTKQKNI